ncbi:MAG: PEP-CTERM sorting domain-containing protein [Verrucomicrobiota bacterium]
MKKLKTLRVAILCLIAAIAFNTSAYSQVIVGNTADTYITASSSNVGDGFGEAGAAGNITVFADTTDPIRVGREATGVQAVAVFVFELPTLTLGQTIGTANFDFTIENTATPSASIDLYGLGFRNTAAVTTNDYFVGALDTTNATLVQNNIFSGGVSVPAGAYSTDASGDSALVSYLNDQYTNGAVGGDFVFLRFNHDGGNTGNRNTFYTANNGTASNRPELTVTVVPEPSTAALLILGFGGLLLSRRKR